MESHVGKSLPKTQILGSSDSAIRATSRASHESVEHGDILAPSDRLQLEQLGYKQEFRREFTRWSTLSYAISIMGVLGSVSATWASPLAAGGPATAIWCWFSGSFFSLCIALSIAELVSAFPTSGGMYFVTKKVFPPKDVPLAAWTIGWSNFLGQTAGVASVDYSVAQMVLAAVSMNSVDDNGIPSYVPSSTTTVAVSIAILVCHGIVCSFPTKTLSQVIRWFAPLNLIASIAIAIALLVLTPNKLPASTVFGTVTDGSGWGSRGFSFLVGYLSVAWTMTDYDATAHLSEEINNAAISGPVAIVQAVLVTWVFGVLLNIAYGFCAGNVTDTLQSGLGNPAAQIFLNAAGRKGGLALWVWPVVIQFFTGITAMLSDTRTAFALARDGALPFSAVLDRVNKRTQTPIYSVWLVVGLCCCLNLIALGSTQTINGIFGVAVPAMDISYIAVVAARLYFSNKQKDDSEIVGPFSLGRWRKPINGIAITWALFIGVIMFMPPTYPVTSENMNYSVALAGFIALFAFGYWLVWGKKTYTGPRTDEI